MTRAARARSRPRRASTSAVMPTLVATMAAPVKMLSSRGSPQSVEIPQPQRNGRITPATATSSAVPPTLTSSEALTSRPTRKSRNMTPRSERMLSAWLGAIQPSTYGPISTPARISPTMPGCPRRSKISLSSLAEANTTSMESGIWAAAGTQPLWLSAAVGQPILAAAAFQAARYGNSPRIGAAKSGVVVG